MPREPKSLEDHDVFKKSYLERFETDPFDLEMKEVLAAIETRDTLEQLQEEWLRKHPPSFRSESQASAIPEEEDTVWEQWSFCVKDNMYCVGGQEVASVDGVAEMREIISEGYDSFVKCLYGGKCF